MNEDLERRYFFRKSLFCILNFFGFLQQFLVSLIISCKAGTPNFKPADSFMKKVNFSLTPMQKGAGRKPRVGERENLKTITIYDYLESKSNVSHVNTTLQ